MSLNDEPIVEMLKVDGSDLDVVNSARCSFGKQVRVLREQDEKLIKYLAKHRHMTPFRHAGATFRITCPIFVARQIHKHQVGVTINEISGRYVEFDDTDYWQPLEWRYGAANVKQGSSNETVPTDKASEIDDQYNRVIAASFSLYKEMLHQGVCREQARAVLPQAVLTQFWMTGTLQAWAHFYNLRIDKHAQREIQVYAEEIGKMMYQHFPYSWEALTNEK